MYHSNDGALPGAWTAIPARTITRWHSLPMAQWSMRAMMAAPGPLPLERGPNVAIPSTNINNTLATLQFYRGITIAAGDPNLSLGGTQDNGTERYSGTTTWTGS